MKLAYSAADLLILKNGHHTIQSCESRSIICFSSLPPEIISDIFLFCACRDMHSFEIRKAPLIFTRVCRSWRAIAYSIPSLWSNMRLPSLPSKASKAISFFCALDNWLSLSRNRPLKFYLQSSSSNSSHIDRYLTILGAHFHRWQDIHFDLPSYSSFPRVSSTKFPFLERLVLNTSGTAGAEAFIVALRFVERLQTLAIHSPGMMGLKNSCFHGALRPSPLGAGLGILP